MHKNKRNLERWRQWREVWTEKVLLFSACRDNSENVEIDIMRHTQDRGEDLSPWKTEQDRVAR